MAGLDEHLRRVLDSRTFAHAPRLRRLLRSLAAHSDGDASWLGPDLGRLRARLDTYYGREGDADGSRIRLRGAVISIEPVTAYPRTPQSLAVLPLFTPTPDHAFLADGLTEDLITALAAVPELRVTGRSSAFQFRERNRNLRQAAMQLSVDNVLEGLLQVSEGRIQLAVQLIDARDGWMLWEEQFDEPLSELLSLRAALLAAVTDALRLENTGAELFDAGTSHVNAYLDDLRGRQNLSTRTAESLKACAQFFRSAINQDSEYARPHAGLAECLLVQAVNDLVSAREVMPQAKTAARRALEITPQSAHALALLGGIKSIYDWNWPEAARDLEEAIQGSKGSPIAFYVDALLHLLPQGRWEDALSALEHVRKLDPASPTMARDLGLVYFLMRDWTRALAEFRKVREIPGSDYWMGRLFIELKRYQEALDQLEPSSLGSHRALSAVAYCYARMGRRGQAEQVLRQLRDLSRRSRVTALDFAHPLIGLGRYDEAFAYLRQAVAERASGLMLFKVDPIYEPLRQDPRNESILAEMGLLG